jgi:hypothetical protein
MESKVLLFVADLCRENLISSEDIIFDDKVSFVSSIQHQLNQPVFNQVLYENGLYKIVFATYKPKCWILFQQIIQENGDLEYGDVLRLHFQKALDYVSKGKNGILSQRLVKEEKGDGRKN